VLCLAVQSVSRCPALGSLDRTRQVASRPLRVHEAARCLTKRSPVEGAPTVDPTLPRREIDEMHTVEERPAIEICRRAEVAQLDGLRECVRVGGNNARHHELVRARVEPLAAYGLP